MTERVEIAPKLLLVAYTKVNGPLIGYFDTRALFGTHRAWINWLRARRREARNEP